MGILQRQADRCTGWHCLTDAQKFGVIFSVCVVTIVLAVAWMCYLGKAAEAHRQRFSTPLPGGRSAPRFQTRPPNTTLGQLPIVQQWPGYQPQIYYQPVVYRLDPQQPPRAFPCPGMGLSQQAPMMSRQIPVTCSALPQSQPQLRALPANAAPASRLPPPRETVRAAAEESSDSSQRCDNEQYSFGWRHRLNRLFRLPVGRASTIASSEHPRRSDSRSTRQSSGTRAEDRRASETRRLHNPVIRQESPRRRASTTQPAQQGSRQSDEVESLDSNLATVHSDDYDLPLRSNGPEREIRRGNQGSGRNQSEMGDAGMEAPESGEGRMEEESDIFPSVSSVSSEDTSLRYSAGQRHGHQSQPSEARFRGPGESDLRTQSSASGGQNILGRETARTRWERR